MYASNKQGDETPLMPASASGSGHTEVVKLLLDKGADVNVRSKVCGEPCILHALVKRYSRGRYSRYRKRKKRNFKNLNVTLKIYAVEQKQ